MSIISGYMVPHPPIAVHEIGRGEEKKIQDTLDAYDAVAKDIARLRPETIIIIHVPFFERHQSGYETQLLAFRFF